jgi:hypothetical protein
MALLGKHQTIDNMVKGWAINGLEHPHVSWVKDGRLGHHYPAFVDFHRLVPPS